MDNILLDDKQRALDVTEASRSVNLSMEDSIIVYAAFRGGSDRRIMAPLMPFRHTTGNYDGLWVTIYEMPHWKDQQYFQTRDH